MSTMTAEKLTVGQEVILVRRSRYSKQDDLTGSVVKVGRRYATAEFAYPDTDWHGKTSTRTKTVEFDMTTGYGKGDTNRNFDRVVTPEQRDRDRRDSAARSFLREAGIDLKWNGHFTLEQVEALATLVRSFAPETTEEQNR